MPEITNQPEYQLGEQDRIVVVGAGGYAAENLYLRNLVASNVLPEQIVLVDSDKDRLKQAQQRVGKGSEAFLDFDSALSEVVDQGKNVSAIIIASTTAAHPDNIRSVINAADAGLINLEKTKVWCEKPMAAPEVFDEVMDLISTHPEMDLSIGYILRFSKTLVELQEYLAHNDLTVTALEWIYSKNRTGDSRPTQGVFPDEVVHPLSATDLILTRAFGDVIGVDVESASIQRRQFADPAVQDKARALNPGVPENPTSDVEAVLHYSFNRDGTVTKIPVKISSSFLSEKESRRVKVTVSGSQGTEELVVDFDVVEMGQDNEKRRIDRLTRSDGTLIYEWDGDKSAVQITQFLKASSKSGNRSDMPTTIKGERTIQGILKNIGQIATTPS